MTTPSELPEPAQALLAQYPTSAPPWPVGAPVENAGDGLADRFRGALLWGAVGDASGRPTEARSWDAIRRRWGLQGVTAYHPWHG